MFEPRYKQMLDDCVLGGEPFGYVASADPPKALGGWALPGQYGLLADAEDVSEQGHQPALHGVGGDTLQDQ